jgi:predicted ATPase
MGIGNVMKSWAQSDTDPDAAIAGMNEALTGLRRAGVQIWTAYPSALVAELMVSRGKVDEGIGLLETVVSQARQNDEGYFLPEIIRIEAKCLQESGRSAEAGALRREALMLAKEQGARPIILRILLDLSKENGTFSAEFDDLLRTTCDSFEEGVELPEIRAARQICAA